MSGSDHDPSGRQASCAASGSRRALGPFSTLDPNQHARRGPMTAWGRGGAVTCAASVSRCARGPFSTLDPASRWCRFFARGGRKRGNRHTDRQTDSDTQTRPSTVTLAAHARRGLIHVQISAKSKTLSNANNTIICILQLTVQVNCTTLHPKRAID